jgi:hypothetical protein
MLEDIKTSGLRHHIDNLTQKMTRSARRTQDSDGNMPKINPFQVFMFMFMLKDFIAVLPIFVNAITRCELYAIRHIAQSFK